MRTVNPFHIAATVFDMGHSMDRPPKQDAMEWTDLKTSSSWRLMWGTIETSKYLVYPSRETFRRCLAVLRMVRRVWRMASRNGRWYELQKATLRDKRCTLASLMFCPYSALSRLVVNAPTISFLLIQGNF